MSAALRNDGEVAIMIGSETGIKRIDLCFFVDFVSAAYREFYER